jgi:hydrogenase maturation protease
MSIIIIGLGNPILSDDGVGIFAARELAKRYAGDVSVDVVEASLAGFNLLDLFLGYEKAIIIDSIMTKGGKVGDIYEFTPETLKHTIRLASIHDLNLATLLEFGKLMKMPIPKEITIFAVEIEDNSTFKEGCCDRVAAAIPKVVEKVLEILAD